VTRHVHNQNSALWRHAQALSSLTKDFGGCDGLIYNIAALKRGKPLDTDTDRIASKYWRVATSFNGVEDREVILQHVDTDPLYNDTDRVYANLPRRPHHARKSG
jgi:hypothetical protein